MRMPWPKSPNMTANRKGKVTIENTAGFASRYVATPYASMMPTKASVILFVLKNVGGIALVCSVWKTVPTWALLTRAASTSAVWMRALAAAGHQPSATRHLAVTSNESRFSVWYTAFSRRHSVVHASSEYPICVRVLSRCDEDASSVSCSSRRRAVTSAFMARWREKSSGNG